MDVYVPFLNDNIYSFIIDDVFNQLEEQLAKKGMTFDGLLAYLKAKGEY